MKKIMGLFLVGLSFLNSCNNAPKNTTTSKREWLLEKLGGSEFAIARSYLDGFDTLKPNEKILLYYLTRAAIAGRDIYIDQRHRDGVKLRHLIEKALDNKDLAPALQQKILKYAKYLWINNGPYHTRTGLKLKPDFTYAELSAALPGENMAWVKDLLFDPNFDPIVTNLTPKSNEGDIIQASATNIYDRGIALKEIESLDNAVKNKLNVRFAKIGDKTVPQPYKIGGVYSKELSNIVHFLKLAAPLATGLQKSTIEKLVTYYETGDEEMFRQSSIDWLKELPPVDMVNGFIETYMDPRQAVGGWEGLAYFTAVDPVLSEFSNNVQYFEDHMPWNDLYKRKNISAKPVATMINVVTATGEGGPVTWSGVNLPNYQDIRTQFGSKNIILINMIETRSQITQNEVIDEFYLPEYRPLMKKHFATARRMVLFMHEVIGHGSGTSAPELTGDPREYIGENYGAWEEARATLIAWHHIKDNKLTEMGAFKKEEHDDVIKALALLELQTQMLQLKNAKHEDVLREAHDRADQLIFEYLRQNTKGFEVVKENGNYYVKITDVKALLKGTSELLTIVHEAKAKGDKATVNAMMEKYGNTFNKEWRDNIVARVQKTGYPDQVAVVFAKLVPQFKDGRIVDIKVDYTESFEEQHRRYGRISTSIEVSQEIY